MTGLTCGLVALALYGVAGFRPRASSSTTFGLLAGLDCFGGGKVRWMVFSAVLAAVCGRVPWLVGPWLNYPRARHQ
jgi:hypothetical protein